MPYRIDLVDLAGTAFERLIDLGALDVATTEHGVAALLPDAVSIDDIRRSLGAEDIRLSAACGRDDDSVWVLAPRRVTVAGVSIVPASDKVAAPDAIWLLDSAAFGTGLHATTALCLEAIRDAVDSRPPPRILDLGTGSGVLALAALRMGVPRAVGIDSDPGALAIAAENARINGLSSRCHLAVGRLDAVTGSWPLIVANIVAAPLIEMAPTLVQRVARGGRLALSGIPQAVAPDVETAYVRLGMRRVGVVTRAGWTALELHPTW